MPIDDIQPSCEGLAERLRRLAQKMDDDSYSHAEANPILAKACRATADQLRGNFAYVRRADAFVRNELVLNAILILADRCKESMQRNDSDALHALADELRILRGDNA